MPAVTPWLSKRQAMAWQCCRRGSSVPIAATFRFCHEDVTRDVVLDARLGFLDHPKRGNVIALVSQLKDARSGHKDFKIASCFQRRDRRTAQGIEQAITLCTG